MVLYTNTNNSNLYYLSDNQNSKGNGMNLGIIIGHTEEAQGARTYNGVSKLKYNRFIAHNLKRLHNYHKINGHASFSKLLVISRNEGWPSVQNQIKANNIDITIELHFNSFDRPARGVETLAISGDLASEDFAQHISSKIAKEYSSPLRHQNGVYDVSRKERGYNNLSVVKAAGVQTAVLVEPGFLNFPSEEAIALVEEPLRYANILYRAIETYINKGKNLNAKC